MAGISYLTAGDVAQINQELENVFATRKLLAPAISLVLWRLDTAAGVPLSIPAQDVVVRYRNVQGREGRTEGAESRWSEVELQKEAGTFDIRVGDTFVLPNGWPGVVYAVPLARKGVQKAQAKAAEGVH